MTPRVIDLPVCAIDHLIDLGKAHFPREYLPEAPEEDRPLHEDEQPEDHEPKSVRTS